MLHTLQISNMPSSSGMQIQQVMVATVTLECIDGLKIVTFESS